MDSTNSGLTIDFAEARVNAPEGRKGAPERVLEQQQEERAGGLLIPVLMRNILLQSCAN